MSCTDKNPLVREGTSIQTRVLNALLPAYARPDERTSADIVLFAKKYAACLKYYNSSNTPDGDWQPLMKMDISVTLASLMNMDIRKCAGYKKVLYKNIKMAGTDNDAKKQFTYLFDLLFSLIKITDEQYNLLPLSLEYRTVFKNIVNTKILLALANLKKLFDEFNTDNLIDTSSVLDSSAPVSVSPALSFNPGELNPEWVLPVASISITVPALLSAKEKIVYIINHNLFNAQVEGLLNSLSMIVARAAGLFEETLSNFPTHSPHYGLFLVFIKLFRHAQEELNTYTQRHLDFYYKDVLQLKNKNPQPDKAHLVFELQKNTSQHLLKKDILFKGGKDVTGKEINYALTEDVVLNKATVAKIHALQVLKGAKEILYASPIAVSEDGQGAKLSSTDKSWFTFGNPANPTAADIGFAIASNMLYMREGTRIVTIKINFANNITELSELSPEPHTGYLRAKLTGEKGWHSIEAATVLSNTQGNRLTFSFTINPDDPAIVPYSEKLHKENFETGFPLLKIYLDQENINTYPYRLLTREKVKSVSVSVNVNGVKDLVLSNDTGAVDASKPFKPFGDFPEENASFYIGSKELFQKKLTNIQFVFGNTIPYDKSNVEYLNDGIWQTISNQVNNVHKLSLTGTAFSPAAVDFTSNEAIAATSLDGFLRLRLNSDDFSKQSYLDLIQTQINQTTVQKTDNDPVTYKINMGTISAVPELTLNRFSVNYEASTNIFLDQQSQDINSRFYHLGSFGYYETYFKSDQPSRPIPLLPESVHDGELLLGLMDAASETVVNILFHVADGSSNPLKQMEGVNWYYLSDNAWIEFESYHVIDRTNNFTQSGIVTFTLPSAISNQNTALEKGLHWIRAAVRQNPDAVCKMILVQAQAASVQLVQDESKQIEYRQPLSLNTIAKLLVSDAAVKTITQSADSFGGRTRESDEHFYVRVSERLRHKQRAIAIWDYEHIILEQFPQIHKVRCINHAGFYTGIGQNGEPEEVFCENYPGHVTIITVPDFKGRSGINPLRPYTPIGVRKNIDDYLRTIVSPFVKLHVVNPQFEEVQFDFKVKFHENLDESFYTILLDNEIEKFLTPWAYDTSREIIFGGTISKSMVLNFVEERPYVDHVSCFKMHHIIKRNVMGTLERRDIETAAATTARSLLVSYFDEATQRRHIINSPEACEC